MVYLRSRFIDIYWIGEYLDGQDVEISAENVDQLKLLFKEKIEGFIPETDYGKSTI